METRSAIIERIKSKEIIIDCHCHVGISFPSYLNFGYPYGISFEDHIIRMKHFGIDCSVVFPFIDSVYYEKNLSQSTIKTTKKYCDFPYELENKNLLTEIYEIFPEYSHQAIPFLMFDPSRATAKQTSYLAELYHKYPIFGLKTVTSYIQAFVTDLETKGKPILEFAQ